MTSKIPQPQFGDRIGTSVFIKHPSLNFGYWVDVNTGQLSSIDFASAYQMASVTTASQLQNTLYPTKNCTEFYRYIRNEKANAVISLYVKMDYETRVIKVAYSICKDIKQHNKNVAKYWLHRRMNGGGHILLHLDNGAWDGNTKRSIRDRVVKILSSKQDRTRLDNDVLAGLQ